MFTRPTLHWPFEKQRSVPASSTLLSAGTTRPKNECLIACWKRSRNRRPSRQAITQRTVRLEMLCRERNPNYANPKSFSLFQSSWPIRREAHWLPFFNVRQLIKFGYSGSLDQNRKQKGAFEILFDLKRKFTRRWSFQWLFNRRLQLKNLEKAKNFCWNPKNPRGHSGVNKIRLI